jgi:L-fuconolactonase
VYDLLVRTRELPAAIELVSDFPDMRFVLDHIAKPRIAAGPRDVEWEQAMEPLAEHENVACKLSGMMTEADWSAWTPRQLQPYVTRVLDWFGPERCMFGSDWPVSLLASDYVRTISTMKELVGEDDYVFGGAAARVYGLS